MVKIFGWLEIQSTFFDEDLHPEVDEEHIFFEIEKLIGELKYTKLNIVNNNYMRYIQFGINENHKTEKTEEILSLFENISRIATGSYGLLYFLDDEDRLYYDSFRVLVSRKGVVEWKKDVFFSPRLGMIEELD